jgi:alpha,alpha-trehalase
VTQPAFLISPRSYRAILFDLDGVVTKTNALHQAAWKEVFDQFLEDWSAATGAIVPPFDEESDFRRYVDGVPRVAGIRRFLTSRGIEIPQGSADDRPPERTLLGLSQAKHQAFVRLLSKYGVEVYEPAVELARQARAAGIKTGLVTSSRHCSLVLQTAGISDLFDLTIDGNEAERMGLRGKPHPDGFEAAARGLLVPSACAVVLDDAVTGVLSAHLGMFGCVIGVDRTGHPEALQASGADLVVTNLRQIAVIREGELIRQPSAELPSALSCLSFIRKLARRKRLVVFLDYDGTLSPIVDRPEDAILPPDTRAAIERLADRYSVAVVSGRDLDDVRRLVSIPNIFYAGSHGFEILTPDERRIISDEVLEYLPLLDSTQSRLEAATRNIPGAAVERKKFSLAVHYRNVLIDRVQEVREVVDSCLAETPDLRMTPGKKVFDFQPRLEWDKGKALLWMLRTLGLDGCATLPLYIGDDVTDEDAFREVQERGVSIVVRDEPRTTAARYALEDPEQVQIFLQSFAED